MSVSRVTEEWMDGDVLIVRFNHKNSHNPMSRELSQAIISACRRASDDPRIGALVLTGGPGRSFCVGGDFNEVQKLKTASDVERWIDETIELYAAVLSINKPVVAAIDGYAIGIGFQLALVCDVRIGTPACQFVMPELEKGIACILGTYMLEVFFGRAAMMTTVLGCRPLHAEECARRDLLQTIVSEDDLLSVATRQAATLSAYPAIPFWDTKRFGNRNFLAGLAGISTECKEVHKRAFAARTAAKHFEAILGTRAAAVEGEAQLKSETAKASVG